MRGMSAVVAVVCVAVVMVAVAPSLPTVRGCDVGACTFYNCVDEQTQCGPSGYAIGYGLKYCDKFTAAQSSFSDQGKVWVAETKQCLQQELEDYVTAMQRDPGASFPFDKAQCDSMRRAAMNSHVKCYTGGSVSVCSLRVSDWVRILKTIHEAFGDAFLNTVKQSLSTAKQCAGSLFASFGSGLFRFAVNPDDSRSRRDWSPEDYAAHRAALRQHVNRVRMQLSQLLHVAESNIFVDVSQVGEMDGNGMDTYVDGPEDAMHMDDLPTTRRTFDIVVHILHEGGRAHNLTSAVVDAVDRGTVDLRDLLPSEHRESAVLLGSGASLGGAQALAAASSPTDAALSSSSSPRSDARTGQPGVSTGAVAAIAVGCVAGTLLAVLALLRVTGHRVVRETAKPSADSKHQLLLDNAHNDI
ncbi:hypothetical protein PTSG_00389 [Salpingoeca rosetta]|uniref:Uncharacterized protein n=1 Tax=Salpingoeca rosetta (strain ATCC 50818 / BSB-021) TaxID=946362 RepID=F2TWC3_SALR5|nr:uncharacterized protein PTSG_00389 [Salpingoeca rosetta]EGD72369.1 hypothetical protein PTSG_00389 [Salpingoeca rosetta]|eukprot:XP_004998938.1 hypothetical protein PTSG_00389 [Salpingoeca rosetta]